MDHLDFLVPALGNVVALATYVFVASLLLSWLEIQIEGPNGWAKDLPAATLFTLARVYARSALAIPDQGAKAVAADRAMALLKQAVAAGHHTALIKQENDLDALRERDDFKELIAAPEAPTAKKKK